MGGVVNIAFLENASASFMHLEASGAPHNPLPFERPTIAQAERITAQVQNPVTLEVLEVSNIIYKQQPDGCPPAQAYWVGRKLRKTIFGIVKECTILHHRNDAQVQWEVTSSKAAVKIMSKQKIRELQHVQDPIKEVAVMQYLNKSGPHPHVMGVLDVLQDEDYLLMFMPLASSGDLFGFVQQAGRFPEPMARYWFLQILEALSHLQKVGVCHRALSLEDILVDEYKTSIQVVFDFDMCLWVPYDNGKGSVTDVTGGGLRRLIKPLIPCGKPNYISPEVLKSEAPFDGFAVDLWASAVILFIMLVGVPPWEIARAVDPRFRMVARGELTRMLHSWKREISPLAADLLQKMLREDPRERLSLCEVKDHPWVLSEESSVGSIPAAGEAVS